MWREGAAALLLIASIGAAAPAVAQSRCHEPTTRTMSFVKRSVEGQTVLVGCGPVGTNSVDELIDALRSGPRPMEIWLDSPGGSVDGGYHLGRHIRGLGIPTRVPRGASCASACVDVFLGGIMRFADHDRAIGIHMGTRSHTPGLSQDVSRRIGAEGERAAGAIIQRFEQEGAIDTAEWTRYVLQMGASVRLVQRAVSVPAGSMQFLSVEELRRLNVVNVRE